MNPLIIPIYEDDTCTKTYYYQIVDSDIATAKALGYNPDKGLRVLLPYRDKNSWLVKQVQNWGIDWTGEIPSYPENWATYEIGHQFA